MRIEPGVYDSILDPDTNKMKWVEGRHENSMDRVHVDCDGHWMLLPCSQCMNPEVGVFAKLEELEKLFPKK